MSGLPEGHFSDLAGARRFVLPPRGVARAPEAAPPLLPADAPFDVHFPPAVGSQATPDSTPLGGSWAARTFPGYKQHPSGAGARHAAPSGTSRGGPTKLRKPIQSLMPPLPKWLRLEMVKATRQRKQLQDQDVEAESKVAAAAEPLAPPPSAQDPGGSKPKPRGSHRIKQLLKTAMLEHEDDINAAFAGAVKSKGSLPRSTGEPGLPESAAKAPPSEEPAKKLRPAEERSTPASTPQQGSSPAKQGRKISISGRGTASHSLSQAQLAEQLSGEPRKLKSAAATVAAASCLGRATSFRQGETLGARMQRHAFHGESGLEARPRDKRIADSVKRLKTPKNHAVKDTESLWAEAFKKFRFDGEVHIDDMSNILEYIGYFSPDSHRIEAIFRSISKYNGLGLGDFLHFVSMYDTQQKQAYEEAFRRCDHDGSGLLDEEMLASLLRTCGVEPMKHVLHEVIQEVDAHKAGHVDFNQFEKLVELVRSRGGFTRKEHTEFMNLFRRFDQDGSGEIDAKELGAVFTWLGFAIPKHRTSSILASVDVDRSGAINERELLICMRRLRDHDLQGLRQAVKARFPGGGGTVAASEAGAVVGALGYVPDHEALLQAAQEVGFGEGTELDMSDLWRVLAVYRRNEGFTSSEAAEIEEAMGRFEKDSSGEICTVQVGKLLRWLGYALPFEVVQHYTAKVDVDGSGRLDLSEVRKLLRMHREQELREINETFERFASQGQGRIANERLAPALRHLGCLGTSGAEPRSMPTLLILELLDEKKNIDRHNFTRIVMCTRRAARQQFRENSGFSPSEAAELRSVFKYYDDNNNGQLGSSELVHLVEDRFPEMAHDKVVRPKLLDIMEKVDVNAAGNVGFSDFLRLMQQLTELRHLERFNKEQQVLKETGFAAQEVESFRDLFLVNSECGSQVSHHAVVRMIDRISPLGDAHAKKFKAMFQDVKGQYAHYDACWDRLDFPEFLLLMRKVVDANFAGINDKTGGTSKPVSEVQ